MLHSRRNFLFGIGLSLAIVRASSPMGIKTIPITDSIFTFTAGGLTLTIEEYTEQYLKPASPALRQRIIDGLYEIKFE